MTTLGLDFSVQETVGNRSCPQVECVHSELINPSSFFLADGDGEEASLSLAVDGACNEMVKRNRARENDASAAGHRDDARGPVVVAQQATRREGACRPRPLGSAGSDKSRRRRRSSSLAANWPPTAAGPMPAGARRRGNYQPVGSKLIPTKSDQTPSTKFLFFPRCLFLLRK
jgi:hypothetical protein